MQKKTQTRSRRSGVSRTDQCRKRMEEQVTQGPGRMEQTEKHQNARLESELEEAYPRSK